ncbi:hypothetical protein MKX03_000079 [Papaver bracteatum]|nr:hypothetical protein MKX03_000079 [Papaver bracteatum]
MDGKELTPPEEQKTLAATRKKKSLLIRQHRIKKSTAERRPIIPRKHGKDNKLTSQGMKRQLSVLAIDPFKAMNRACSKSIERERKRERFRGDSDDDVTEMDDEKKL